MRTQAVSKKASLIARYWADLKKAREENAQLKAQLQQVSELLPEPLRVRRIVDALKAGSLTLLPAPLRAKLYEYREPPHSAGLTVGQLSASLSRYHPDCRVLVSPSLLGETERIDFVCAEQESKEPRGYVVCLCLVSKPVVS